MKLELAIEFSRVTEAAALTGYKWLGRGDKNAADGAAVQAMRIMLNQVDINGQIVIGEGEMQQLGVKVFAIPDGDVAASILTCMLDSEVDVLYGIGGAPEGVISAVVIRALDGDMRGRLLARH